MFNLLLNSSPILQAFIATLFTWGMTILGSAVVFFFKDVNRTTMDSLLGLSGGVMIAASFWSLINPAIEMAKELKLIPWIVVSIGILSGGLLIILGDKLYNLCVKNSDNYSTIKRSFLLILSITLHNIPEGLVIGVAFGSLFYGIEGSSLWQAISLAIGIGIQNFPEGSAVSLPLKRDGFSCKKAFFYGQLSGIVEPIAAILGVLMVLKIQVLLPFLLAFAAGAMLYVVISELIPESQKNSNKSLVSIITLLGFIIMMILDISLG